MCVSGFTNFKQLILTSTFNLKVYIQYNVEKLFLTFYTYLNEVKNILLYTNTNKHTNLKQLLKFNNNNINTLL